MKRKMNLAFAIPFSVMVGMLAGGGALAQDAPVKAKVEGEVVQVMEQTRAGELGNLDAVMVRTRKGEQVRLLLGEAGSCVGCVQVGDRVRVRLMKNGVTADGYQVRAMKVQRTGETTRFRNTAGELMRLQARDRTQDGTGQHDRVRDQDRTHRPSAAGTGGGSGGGTKGGGRR